MEAIKQFCYHDMVYCLFFQYFATYELRFFLNLEFQHLLIEVKDCRDDYASSVSFF